MKLHWWIAGAIIAAVSAVLVMKHSTESKDKCLDLVDNGKENNCAEFPADIYESEFEGTEFLV